MKENIKIFKDAITQLQIKNQELQQQHLPMTKEDLDQMNALFGGLRDDNSRLASEIKRLTKENSELQTSQHFCTEKLNEQSQIIHSLQETNRAQTKHHLETMQKYNSSQ